MEEFNKLFKKFLHRLELEGVLKSLAFGTIVSSILSLISSIALFLSDFNAIYISIIILLGGTFVFGLIAYFFKFRPSEKDVARRVDLEGLKERLVTMVECKDDSSFMAKMQREDALKALNKVSNIKLKLNIESTRKISASIALVLAVLGIILSSFSLNGGLPSFDDIINNPNSNIMNVNVSYFENEGGHIEGELFQIIPKGSDASEVLAVADDGYMFEIWSDGVTTPTRCDLEVNESFEVFALFIEITEAEDVTDKNDERVPGDDSMGNVNGDGKPPHGSGAAGKYEEYNQVIDGETYYRDVYKEYYDKAIEILNSGGVVPEYIRIIIEEYYGVIK